DAAEHALISLLALNGLRVSEATGASIEALGSERGHRTLTIIRTGGKVVTIPLAPRTARAIDLAIGERTDGPIFLAFDGRRLDRHGAARIVRGAARRAGVAKPVGATPVARQRPAPRAWGPAGPGARRAGRTVRHRTGTRAVVSVTAPVARRRRPRCAIPPVRSSHPGPVGLILLPVHAAVRGDLKSALCPLLGAGFARLPAG